MKEPDRYDGRWEGFIVGLVAAAVVLVLFEVFAR